MNRRVFLGLMFGTLLAGTLTPARSIQPAKARTIVVPDNYPTIQEAINNANEGDTVFVRNGTYYENVVVNRAIRLAGECWENTTIDGRREHAVGYAITVIASNVLVSGFTVQNWSNGIYGSTTGTTYQQNLIRDNGFGFNLHDCANNNLSDNIFIDNYFGSLISSSSEHITIRRDTFTDNVRNLGAGMGDDAGISSTLAYDIDDSNTVNGKPIYYLVNARNFKVPTNAGFVAAINSSDVTIEGLDLANNGIGVLLIRSSNCYIANVNATDNDDCGISLRARHNRGFFCIVGLSWRSNSGLDEKGSSETEETACSVSARVLSYFLLLIISVKCQTTHSTRLCHR